MLQLCKIDYFYRKIIYTIQNIQSDKRLWSLVNKNIDNIIIYKFFAATCSCSCIFFDNKTDRLHNAAVFSTETVRTSHPGSTLPFCLAQTETRLKKIVCEKILKRCTCPGWKIPKFSFFYETDRLVSHTHTHYTHTPKQGRKVQASLATYEWIFSPFVLIYDTLISLVYKLLSCRRLSHSLPFHFIFCPSSYEAQQQTLYEKQGER